MQWKRIIFARTDSNAYHYGPVVNVSTLGGKTYLRVYIDAWTDVMTLHYQICAAEDTHRIVRCKIALLSQLRYLICSIYLGHI